MNWASFINNIAFKITQEIKCVDLELTSIIRCGLFWYINKYERDKSQAFKTKKEYLLDSDTDLLLKSSISKRLILV